MSEENLCHQSSKQFTSTELENGCADSEDSISAELCRTDSESQVSSYGIHFGVEIAETVVPHNAKKCTTVSDTKNRHMHLENSVSEAENQSDMFDFGCDQTCSSQGCFDRNLEAECNGGLWEIDNIEDQLEKFVSEEIADDVSSQVFQNSDKFNNSENTFLDVVVPDEFDLDPAYECCHIPSGSVRNFSQSTVNVMNSCDSLLESISTSMIDHCYSKRVGEQFSFCDKISELHQLQSPEDKCLQTSNILNKGVFAQLVTEENVELVRFEVMPRVGDANGGIPEEQCVAGNEADQPPDESFLTEKLSSVKDMNIEGPLLNWVEENSSVSNSFTSNNLTPLCQSTSLSDSNCAIRGNSAEVIEDSVPPSLITDSSVVLHSTLLQSANCMVNECSSSVSNNEGIMKPLDGVNDIVNEKVHEVVANGLPADGQTSVFKVCGFNDVIGKIKKEEQWLSDDGTCASDWREPTPYGLKQCYCPHGYVSPTVGHFHCQECGISSRFRSSMINHEVVKHRVKHSGVKFLLCGQCSSVFICVRALRRHVMKHNSQVGDGKTEVVQSGSDFELCESLSPIHAKGRCRSCRRLSALVPRREKSSEVTVERLESQKRKLDEPTPIDFNKFKPSLDQVTGKSIPLPEEYKVTILTAGKTVTTCHPAYDGPLLPVLLKPTNICEICRQRFAAKKLQSRHYAQVHRLYLRGESVFKCTACKYRTTYHSDFKVHIGTERHRIAASKENEQNLSPGEARLTDDETDACHKNIVCGTKKKKWKPYGLRKIVKKPFMPSKSCKVLRPDGRKVSRDNCSKTDSVVKDNVSRFANRKLKAKVSKCYPYEKINKFFSLMRTAKENVGDCSNFSSHFQTKTARNACVSGHVCKSDCICSFNSFDETASDNSKQSCIQSELDDKRSSGSTAVASPDEFNPIIVESYSCKPSTWSNTPGEKELADLPSTPKPMGRMNSKKTKLKSSSVSFYDSKMQTTDDDRPCSRSVSAMADSPSTRMPTECINLNEPKLKSTSLSFYDKEVQKTDDNRLCSRSISTMAKGVKFYQNTRDSLLTSVVAQNANPTSTCEDSIPASKFQTPVTLERSSSSVGKDLTACEDSDNPVVIQDSDEESESSNSMASTAFSKHRVKTKQIVSSSSADPLRPGFVNSSVSGNTCSLADIIELDDDSDDSNIVTESRSGSTVAVSSELSRPTVAHYYKDASLSKFSSEVLFSELKNRSFVRLCHCGVYFLDSDIYNLHCAWHLDGDLLKCNFCGVDNRDWYEFYSHILNHSK